MKRLTEETVFSGLVTAWFFVALPTTRSPSLRKPSTDGVVRSPSAFTRISGSLPSMTAIAEFVVPKSIPRILDIMFPLLLEIVTVVSRGRLSEEPLRVFAAAPSTYPFDIAYYKI